MKRIALAAIAALSMSFPAIASISAASDQSVTCAWDENEDGKVDRTFTALLAPQRAQRIDWQMRCHRARLVIDETYDQSDLLDTREPLPTMHWWGWWFDPDKNGQTKHWIKVEIPEQSNPSCDMECWAKVRRALDDNASRTWSPWK